MKEIYNTDLDEIETEREKFKTGNRSRINLVELDVVFDNNKSLKNIPEIKDRFITNNDRHLGNFAVLYNEDTKKIQLAPIYDNGNAFYNKHSLKQININLIR